MTIKELKAFVTRDDFILPSSKETSPIYELSEISNTYSINKKTYYSPLFSNYSLHQFKLLGDNLNLDEINSIFSVIKSFSEYITSNSFFNKQQVLIIFTNNFNSANPSTPITDLSYNNVVTENNIKVPDYITFNIRDVKCSIWISDENFRAFYPNYDINIVTPFSSFNTVVNNNTAMIQALNEFSLIDFNKRIEENKDNLPTTYTRILNIPYKVPGTSVHKDCYFAFNIYGLQGNYDHILKLELFDYLTNTLGIAGTTVESLFPNILQINEFIIVPRWDKVAIPTQVGSTGISSQISNTYSEVFDIFKFVTIYDNETYLKNNTYNVPYDYNNLLLQVVNGYYTEPHLKDFKSYYSDMLAVTSTHPDFSRMSMRTQRFMTLLENIIDVSNSSNQTELFNNILQNSDYYFTIIVRNGVTYISYKFEDHQIYVIPKFEFESKLQG